jgi:hypothetical protein
MFGWKSERKTALGRPRYTRKDNIKTDVKMRIESLRVGIQISVAVPFQNGNGITGSVKAILFRDQMSECLFLNEDSASRS